jgi:high affinity Mn2+ porin
MAAPPADTQAKDQGRTGKKPATPAETVTYPASRAGAKEAEPAKEKNVITEGQTEDKHRQPWLSAHAQGTIVTQTHDVFPSPYIGPLSLLPKEPAATTETATVFLDVRLWQGGEIVFDPEISGGKGLSGTSGLAGFPNGEATRVGAPEPTPYIARLFYRQTWELSGEQEKVEDGPNQIAGTRPIDRVVVTVGKMAATDIADNNLYSRDPRTQMLNWALWANGAWDYPANVRGYTYGIALEFNTLFWALHYGIFGEPSVANGAPIDPHIVKANGQILELEERWGLNDQPGRLREWVFANQAHMGKYSEALEEMPVDPDVTLTRTYRFKYGFGMNVEQQLARDVGVWARAGWNDGHSESWAFTAIDRTGAVGLWLKGRWWKRPNDEVGLAGAVNGLERSHREYLAAGGLDFIIGDGRLNYAPEQIIEMYYDWQIIKGIFATVDFQGVNHPAYNADRGPVAIGALRVHMEF